MVDLMGKGYVVDYCISLLRKKQEQRRFQVYITDVLMVLNNNIQHCFGGAKITQRYADYFVKKKEDTRTAKQIVQDTIKKAGLRFAKDVEHE